VIALSLTQKMGKPSTPALLKLQIFGKSRKDVPYRALQKLRLKMKVGNNKLSTCERKLIKTSAKRSKTKLKLKKLELNEVVSNLKNPEEEEEMMDCQQPDNIDPVVTNSGPKVTCMFCEEDCVYESAHPINCSMMSTETSSGK